MALIAPLIFTTEVEPKVAVVSPATSECPNANDTPAPAPMAITKSSVFAVRSAVALSAKALAGTPLSEAVPLNVTVLEPLASMVELITAAPPSRPPAPPEA